MIIRPNAVERAYQLAQSGDCASIAEIKSQMKREGYSIRHISAAPLLSRTLRKLCASSHSGAAS
jgi:hypothetical protein